VAATGHQSVVKFADARDVADEPPPGSRNRLGSRAPPTGAQVCGVDGEICPPVLSGRPVAELVPLREQRPWLGREPAIAGLLNIESGARAVDQRGAAHQVGETHLSSLSSRADSAIMGGAESTVKR
jgi:antitoxin (DNA-binding transcriptional repressor) of toxin-antitoxin stability system